MWNTITNSSDYFDIVKVVDPTLDTVEISDCIDKGVSIKDAECYHYDNVAYDLCLYVYRNFTLDYWVVNYTTTGTYDLGTVCNILLTKIREIIDTKSATTFRIRITTAADPLIIDWFKNTDNVWEYSSVDELHIGGSEYEHFFHRIGE